MLIDLRSDTLTRPTPAMLQAMFDATVGDDVFNDDPTVIKLEEKAAAIFGKEDALFCGSGIMCNQVSIKLQVNAGEKVLCDELSHIYYHEMNGPAFISGIKHHLVNTQWGKLNPDLVTNTLKSENTDKRNVALVSLENTVNKGGGCYYTLNEIKEISLVCKKENLPVHLDGARIFNALVETGDDAVEVGKQVDTISFCLSKGLGAPVGSMIVASKEKIKEARKIRNQFGGGMRQVGYLAAAGIYALDNNVERLKDDHERAKILGEELKKLSFVSDMYPVQTNIVIFRLPDEISTEDFLQKLLTKNIKAVAFGKQLIRFTTHLDFTNEMLGKLIAELRNLY